MGGNGMRSGKFAEKGRKRQEEAASYTNMGSGWPVFIAICRFWPDLLADILRADDAEYELALIQRMFLRINARYANVDITGCRGITKSFCTLVGEYLDDLTWPGIEGGIFGPSIRQTASIAQKVNSQIARNYPLLVQMLAVERSSIDTFVVTTPYGSRTSIEAFRGNTIHKVVAEETAQEENPPFDFEEFQESVVPQVRGMYKVNNRKSRAYIPYKQHSITSAGRRQGYAYLSRARHRVEMIQGKSAFVIDCGVECVLLCQIRDAAWVEKQKNEVGLEGVPRELESIYSGTDKNPIIRDGVLSEARSLLKMEEHHCCKDLNNRKIKPQDVIYIVGNDISYRDSKNNARNACVVLKCTKQDDYYHKDKYLKQVVWVEDWSPAATPTPRKRAERIRRIWDRFTYEGSQTYLVVDAWQVGDDVVKALMEQPNGGGVPLCIYKHADYTELELEGAIPVIYPIRAGVYGTADPDSEMIKNAQMQFEYTNVQLLTANLNDGVEEYKRYHRIKDDSFNHKILQPYKKTNELIRQIQNLREEPSGQGIREKRISKSIQRDSWSALKYALRFAQILERSNLANKQVKNDWDKLLAPFRGRPAASTAKPGAGSRVPIARRGGKIF